MMIVKTPRDLSGSAARDSFARAGYEEEALPVSCFLSDAPDSPLQGSSLSSGSRTSSFSMTGHLMAESRTSFEDLSLHDPREQTTPALRASSSVLNSKLAQLLDRRKLKETEIIRTIEAEHAAEIMALKAAHRDALELKDCAHRSVMDDMVSEFQQLKLQLAAARQASEAAEEDCGTLRDNLQAEQQMRAAVESELAHYVSAKKAAEDELIRLKEELHAERNLREAAEVEQQSLHALLEAELEAM